MTQSKNMKLLNVRDSSPPHWWMVPSATPAATMEFCWTLTVAVSIRTQNDMQAVKMTQSKNTKLLNVWGFESTTLVDGALDRSATMEFCWTITIAVSTWTQNSL